VAPLHGLPLERRHSGTGCFWGAHTRDSGSGNLVPSRRDASKSIFACSTPWRMAVPATRRRISRRLELETGQSLRYGWRLYRQQNYMNRLASLQWLRDRGYIWTERTAIQAAASGHLKLLQVNTWAMRCSSHGNTAFIFAAVACSSRLSVFGAGGSGGVARGPHTCRRGRVSR
jgi:hypothetical protein